MARGINDDGWVVGRSSLDGDVPPGRAFVHDGIAMHDLNGLIDPTSGWDLRDAYDINNRGQIVAVAAFVTDGTPHAVLLTPIPEPASCAPIAIAALMLRRRRRTAD